MAGLKKEEDDVLAAETPAAPSRFAAAVQDSVAAQDEADGCAVTTLSMEMKSTTQRVISGRSVLLTLLSGLLSVR